MKKIKISILFLGLVLVSSSSALAQAFEQGKSYVSASYGYAVLNGVKLLGTAFSEAGINIKTKNFGPMSLKYEYAISEKLGVGASFGYSSSSIETTKDSSDNKTYFYNYNINKFTAKARLNWHLADHDKLDPYLGFGLGYRHRKSEYTTNDNSESNFNFNNLIPVSFEATFGLRYMFIPNFGAFGEIGIGHGFAHIGLVGKF